MEKSLLQKYVEQHPSRPVEKPLLEASLGDYGVIGNRELPVSRKRFRWYDDHPNGSALSNYVQYSNSSIRANFQVDEPFLPVEDLVDFGFEVAEYFLRKGNTCSKTGWQTLCPECHTVNFKPKYCGDHVTCPVCNRAYSVSQGRELYYRLTAGCGHYVGFLTLTVSKDDLRFGNASLKDKLAAEDLLRKLANRFMKQEFNGFPYFSVVHCWNSRNPTLEPHYHIHILVNLAKLENGKVVLRNGFMTEERLEGLRGEWASFLGYPIADLHYAYAYSLDKSKRGIGKIRHWCNYIMRLPCVDLNKYLLETGRKELSESEEARYEFNLEYPTHYRRCRGYGAFCGKGVNAYLLAVSGGTVNLQVVKEWIKDDIEEAKRIYCMSCANELTNAEWLPYSGHIPREYMAVHNDPWACFVELT